MNRTINVYQFNDFKQPDINAPFTEYYHAARIPASELIDTDIVAIAEFLILSSFTTVWYSKKMRPMRKGDLVVVTNAKRQVMNAYILAPTGLSTLPQFTQLALEPFYLSQEEYEHEEHDLDFSCCR